MSQNPQSHGDGAIIQPEYNKQLAQQTALKGLSTQTEPTPDPSGNREHESGGIIRRANEFRTNLGPVALESFGLHGMEISKSIKKRADELYRNQFPRFEPRFTRKCTECGCEFDEDIDRCDECDAQTREPSQAQRTEAEEFFRSVNREGQSLRSLYEFLARDSGRLGVWAHVVKKTYGVINGEVIERVDELVRADPKRIKPVVDENGRIGGHWWTCPIHRPPQDGDVDPSKTPGKCEECGADLREVRYAEVEEISDDEPTKVFFEDEIISHAPFEPMLAGKDGLSPVASIWLKQAILEWMDLYAAGFYDQDNTNRFPGKMGFIHTTNKNAVEKQLEMAQDEKDEDAYAQGFIYNEVPRGADSTTDKVQVIDMMSDDILGQSDTLKKDYKSDIRGVYGLTDAQDSEMQDAGGLNNEGLQLEINDRDKASAQQDLRDGPLRKLMDVLGYGDWQLAFVPPQREEEEPSTLETVQAAAEAKQNGIPFEIEDGRIEILDSDGPVDADEPADEDTPGDGTDDGSSAETDPPDVSVGQSGTADPRNADEPHGDRDEALRTLEEGFKHMVWPTTDELTGLEQQSREPYFADDEDMPEFVADLVAEAIENGTVHLGEYKSANVTGNAIKGFLKTKLTQPQGWSLRSLAEDFAERWQIPLEEAMDALRPQVASVLNESRKIGYEQLPEADERLFKWIGPDDEETTDACEWLKEQTNPKHGGSPVPLDELEELIAEAQSRWFPSFSGDMAVHYNERHTFVQHYD